MGIVPRLTVDGRQWHLPAVASSRSPSIANLLTASPSAVPQSPQSRESFFVFSDDPAEVARSDRAEARWNSRKRRSFPAIEDRTPLHELTDEELGVRAWAREWIMRKQTSTTLPAYRGPVFDLRTVTIDLIVDLWRQQCGICALSGRRMIIPQLRNVGGGCQSPVHKAHIASVDRIDSGVGYQAGNIQLACYMANCMKTNMQADEFVSWCVDVAKTHG